MKRKRIYSCYILGLLGSLLTAYAVNAPREKEQNEKDQLILKAWKAGEKVSLASIDKFGESNCFVIEEISDALFNRINGKSYKKNCTVPRKELRYIKTLHYNLEGKICLGEMICNKTISNDLMEIFKALYRNKYPIERMVLIDNYDADDERSMLANNSSGFNFRFVPGTQKLSNHSRGMAVDINPLYNPYVRTNKSGKTIVSPESGKKYVDRSRNFPYKIDRNDLCYKEFIKRGFTWGGSWRNLKDYQHFEKTK
ncbi:M15 family metallopeptidase [Phocaeicola sp.]